jgi:hypothetical protein
LGQLVMSVILTSCPCWVVAQTMGFISSFISPPEALLLPFFMVQKYKLVLFVLSVINDVVSYCIWILLVLAMF